MRPLSDLCRHGIPVESCVDCHGLPRARRPSLSENGWFWLGMFVGSFIGWLMMAVLIWTRVIHC